MRETLDLPPAPDAGEAMPLSRPSQPIRVNFQSGSMVVWLTAPMDEALAEKALEDVLQFYP